MTIKIMNLRNNKPVDLFDFRIDRQSAVGNPYPITKEHDRDAVCNHYNKYFRRFMDDNPTFREYINLMIDVYQTYGKLRLFCWCAPKRCHGETIKEYILSVCNNKSTII